METLLDIFYDKIQQYNRRHPIAKIEWELKRDKIKEILKKQEIPNKFKKKGIHQSNKYLTRDEVKHLDFILNDVMADAERLGIEITTSPSRRFSRTPSPLRPSQRNRTHRNGNVRNATRIAINRIASRTAEILHRMGR